MATPPKPNNLPERMGAVEARMDKVELRMDAHEQRIAVLEQGDAAMLLKLSENDQRWQTVESRLRVVDQIQDIQTTMSTIGKIFISAAKISRWCITTIALVAGVYMAIHTGDLSALSTFISQLLSLGN